MLIEEAKRSNSSSSKRTQARCKDSLASSKGKSQAQHCQKPARRNCWYTQADIGGFKSLSLWISVNCTVSPWVSQVWSRIRSSRIISHHKFRASNAVLQARTSCLRDQEHGALWELLQQYKQYSNLYSNMSPNICANTPKNSKGILHVTSLTQKWKPHSLLQPIRRPVSGWFRLQCRKEPISMRFAVWPITPLIAQCVILQHFLDFTTFLLAVPFHLVQGACRWCDVSILVLASQAAKPNKTLIIS